MSYQEEMLRREGLVPSGKAPSTHFHFVPSSHKGISHDSLAGLGYDWSRIADPGIAAKPPFKVYLPRTTEDVVRAVTQSREDGEPLIVRGHGHSSNNLVTPDGGTVMLTEHMDRILSVDEKAMTVTVQGGATLMKVDVFLSEMGLGLPIIGDHDHITAAGFASVGGISPASHRFGMFVDTVQALEYVGWDGKVRRVNRVGERAELMRLLCGTGQHGIITELTISIVRVDKFRTVYANRRHVTPSLADFVRHSGEAIRNPGDAVMERGVWADFELPGVRLSRLPGLSMLPDIPALPGLGGMSLRLGQFSSYHATTQRAYKSLWNDIAYGYQHALGNIGGRLPAALDDFVKYLGMGCVMLSPRYAVMKNIERFTDQVLDATVGDPTRMFVVLAPADRYETLFYQLYEACVAERKRSGAITFISMYVKSIRSPYLSGDAAERRFCEVMLYIGVRPEKMTPAVLERLVARVDQITIANQAFRYMHSLTGTDPAIRERVDPNARYGKGGGRDAATAGRPTATAAAGASARPMPGAPPASSVSSAAPGSSPSTTASTAASTAASNTASNTASNKPSANGAAPVAVPT